MEAFGIVLVLSLRTNASGSYLFARFGADPIVPAGAERTDQHGRTVYFIARDGELFGKYILTLHAARDEKISCPSLQEREMTMVLLRLLLLTGLKSRAFYSIMWKEKHRHYFSIADQDSVIFYRYFRLTGFKGSDLCLHGVGLELYGGVYEE